MAVIVSIALATYNGERYLQEQLQSFTDQTRQPDELIICDDASTDNTLSIINKYAETAPFTVKVFSNETNIGYVRAFSWALELCSGDYVFLSDQDDVWLPEKIATIVSCFESDQNVQLLIHDLEYCREDLSPIGQTKIARMSGVFDLERHFVTGMATVLRGSFLRLCLPIPNLPEMTHDTWLHQCASAIQHKSIIPAVLALYRRHSTNATAAGDLNVDFVTTPEHFKTAPPSFHFIVRLVGLFKDERVIGIPELSPLTLWLQLHKKILIEEYGAKSSVEKLITEDTHKVMSIRERLDFLSKNRWQRIVPVLKFYLHGKYQSFGGWKSTVKDLLVR
ncbi:MAG: glycosyltransferase family 2 protein [Anaerolineaceae bacterium]|nr:glycosyltransferase family 2 protein [Anaerolineaceae bacterium]